MTFKKWIEENRFWGMDGVQKRKYPAIPEDVLGEWAWGNFLISIKGHDENMSKEEILSFYLDCVSDFENYVKDCFLCPCDIFIEVAIGCLGEKEINKRLIQNGGK